MQKELSMQGSIARTYSVRAEPVPSHAHAHGHEVRFYEGDGFLHSLIADLVANAVANGQPALILATEAHQAGWMAELRSRGTDPDGLIRGGQLFLHDAREALDSIMVGDTPDPERFEREVGRFLQQARGGDPERVVAVFGELVNLLCADGKAGAALVLEDLWNQLARRSPFSLTCAYSLGNFADASQSGDFLQICRLHDHVQPTEHYTALSETERLTEISALQQRARALETELEHSRELERRLRDARREAEAANHARCDFLAVMSHELRTPLNAIAGYADLLDLGVHGPLCDAQRLSVQRIQKSQRHLLGLIDAVLSYTGMEQGAFDVQLEDVAIRDVLRSADVYVHPHLDAKRLTYVCGECDPSILVRADREKLDRILVNLLVNAVKFTDPGGEIRLECEATGDRVEVRVRDTGIGVPADKVDLIFQPFVQVDARLTRPQAGVGLGLAVSRQLARAMGGELAVSSTPGFGSTFTLTLPRGPLRP